MSVKKIQSQLGVMKAGEEVLLEIRTYLEQKKKQIMDEIIHYPPPIPACDVQFNYLLAERSQVEQALIFVRKTAGGEQTDEQVVTLLKQFISSCEFVDEAAAARWVQRVEMLFDDE